MNIKVKGLSLSRLVHYVYKQGVECAALIVQVRNEEGLVDLHVWFPINVHHIVGFDEVSEVMECNVPFSSEAKPRTWHFPEKS